MGTMYFGSSYQPPVTTYVSSLSAISFFTFEVLTSFHKLGPLVRVGLVVAMSVHMYVRL